jgi:hypothetical protein
MTKIKLTKTAVDAATFAAKEYELRDTVVPGFLLKVTPAGRKIFMVQYRTNAGERRKPALGRSVNSRSSKHVRSLKIGLPTCARAKTQVRRKRRAMRRV